MPWEKLSLSEPRRTFGQRGTFAPSLPHIYVSTEDYSVMENLVNRTNRPYQEWKPVVKKMLEDDFDIDTSKVTISWSQRAGCTMCPCSPGFIIKPKALPRPRHYQTVEGAHEEIRKIGSWTSMWLTVRWTEPETVVESRLKNKKVVFTGAMAVPRKELMAAAKNAGVTVQSAVNRDTDYLVCSADQDLRGDQPNPSTKYRKARSLGKTIIDENEFMEAVA